MVQSEPKPSQRYHNSLECGTLHHVGYAKSLLQLVIAPFRVVATVDDAMHLMLKQTTVGNPRRVIQLKGSDTSLNPYSEVYLGVQFVSDGC
jgi:hypothetical protein